MRRKKKLVWDTSSLSYALETYSHAAVSAYVSAKNKTWPILEKRLENRIKGEYESRELLTKCGTDYTCEVPDAILDEIEQAKELNREIDVVLPEGKELIERWYGRRAKGFSKVFRPTLYEKKVAPWARQIVEEEAKKLKLPVSSQDITAVALAFQDDATLVTADRAMEKLAKSLNIPVIFTMGQANKVNKVRRR